MPALSFGLPGSKVQNTPTNFNTRNQIPQKRKAVFGGDDEDEEDAETKTSRHDQHKTNKNGVSAGKKTAFGNTTTNRNPGKAKMQLKPLTAFDTEEEEEDSRNYGRDISTMGKDLTNTYGLNVKSASGKNQTRDKTETQSTNLSSLRSAKLQDQKVADVDSSVYDYDGVYETFHLPKDHLSSKSNTTPSGPKYMTSLMQSAETRKRDQLRAKEKLLQRERELEGDEFAEKEKFVTAAYKEQQEQIKKMEEEERRKEKEEEERKRKGGGMTAFHLQMLKKDEERSIAIARAMEDAEKNKFEVEDERKEISEAKMAKDLNEKGAKIVVNDDGEVVDKRQLLSAGLNTAPPKKSDSNLSSNKIKDDATRKNEYRRPNHAIDARQAQRERQTRMMELQIEEMTKKQRQEEEEQEKARQEATKSKVSENDRQSARERYLQRKKEREEEAKKTKAPG